MMDSGMLLLSILAAAAAVPILIWLGLKMYVAIGGVRRCRGCGGSERSSGCGLHLNLLDELERAGRNVRGALIVVALLLTVMWTFGTAAAQRNALEWIGWSALICMGVLTVSKILGVVVGLRMPTNVVCKERVRTAMKKNNGFLTVMTAVFVLLHFILNIG